MLSFGRRAAWLLACARRISVAAGLSLCVFATGAAATNPAILTWSPPVLVDRGAPATGSLGGVGALACPSTALCVGFDDLGNALQSTDPTRIGSWRVARLRGALAPTGVSCPSTLLCVAVDSSYYGAGRILLSTDPAAGPPSWRVEPVRAEVNPEGIACPSTTLCVVSEADGNVVTSTDPTGGAGTWHVAHIDSAKAVTGDHADLEGVSCPSASLCVAVDDAGDVLTSTDPAGGTSAWKLVRVPGLDQSSPGNAAVSCPSVSACFAIENGTIVTSTNPAGGSSAWTASNVAASSVDVALSCASPQVCIATRDDEGSIDSLGFSLSAAGSWQTAHVDGTNELTAISCPAVTVCVIADDVGNLVTGSTNIESIRVPVVQRPRMAIGQLTSRRQGAIVRVPSSLTVECPPSGPGCAVTGTASEGDTNPAGYVSIARVRMSIPAGAQRKIAFTLSQSGAHLLKRHRFFELGLLDIVARAGRGAAVGNEWLFSLDAAS
jgi:hypothetical protein